MEAAPLFLTSDDPGVLVAILQGASLPDWRRLAATAPWMLTSFKRAEPALRKIRADGRTPMQCCAASDVSGLWASVSEHEPELDLLALLHCAIAHSGNESSYVLSWLLSRPKGEAAALAADPITLRTALHVAARSGNTWATRRIFRIPDVCLDPRDSYEATPLLDAVDEDHTAVVACLIKERADPNAFVPNCHGHGATPLILAVRKRNARIVRCLLSAPALDLYKPSMEGVPFASSAIDFAPSEGPVRDLLEAAVKKHAQSPASSASSAGTPSEDSGKPSVLTRDLSYSPSEASTGCPSPVSVGVSRGLSFSSDSTVSADKQQDDQKSVLAKESREAPCWSFGCFPGLRQMLGR